MKALNVRLNPTTNGDLHLGHMYLALVNYAEARRSKGRFILRFDDNQEEWIIRQGNDAELVAGMSKRMIYDLSMFGIEPDEVVSQIEQHEEMNRILLKLNGGPLVGMRGLVSPSNPPEMVGKSMGYYGYTPCATAEKVVYDFMSSINCLIRGEDLITESTLYTHFQEIWGIQISDQVYLPRLLDWNGLEMSKTAGWSIKGMLQEGYTVDDLMRMLRDACLENDRGDWDLDNIKPGPVLPERWW